MKQFQTILGIVSSILVIISSTIVISSGVLGIAGKSFSTETQTWKYEGSNPQLDGTEGVFIWMEGYVELDDRYNDKYYSTAWKSHSGQTLAEPVFMKEAYVNVYETGRAWNGANIRTEDKQYMMYYWYEWYINGEIARTWPENQPATIPWILSYPSGEIYRVNLAVDDFPILGEQTGELEVVLKCTTNLYHAGVFGNWDLDLELVEKPLAKDGAYLKSGAGKVKAVDELVEIGDSAKILVETGNIHNQGWTMRFYPPEYVGLDSSDYGKSNPLNGFSGQDNYRGYVYFEVPDGWFEIGQEDSEVRVELWNQLWQESVTTFFTIDNKEWAPGYGEDPNSKIVSVEGNFEIGESLTVTLHANPNNETKSQISHFWVYVYYGEPGAMPGFSQDYIINKAKYDADPNGDARFSFNIPRDGNIVIRALAVDEDGRTSEPGYYGIVIYPIEDGTPGFGEWVTKHFPWIANSLVYIIAFAIILISAVIFYLWWKWQFDLLYLIIALALIIITGIAGIYYAGVTP